MVKKQPTKTAPKKSIKTLKTGTSTKTNSPFKDVRDFEKEIIEFANKFKATVVNQAKRISDYFEMTCYNYIVRYYEKIGYEVNIQNLISGAYRYKCSTAGIQSNFSYFSIAIEVNKTLHEYEIHHNLAAQSSHDAEVFTTPDICIVKKDSVQVTDEYYDTKRKFSFVTNDEMLTFCEVKQFNPFPELIFNFIGVVNELKKTIISNQCERCEPAHLAPSLLISGKSNKQTERIKASLEARYNINVLYDLFYSATATFSKNNLKNIRQVGKLP